MLMLMSKACHLKQPSLMPCAATVFKKNPKTPYQGKKKTRIGCRPPLRPMSIAAELTHHTR